MISGISTALTGYNAATARVKTAADNLANQFSTARLENGEAVDTPYVPQQVQAVSQESGGVTTRLVGKTPATLAVPSGDGSVATVPNVDAAEELTTLVVAESDARANLSSIKVQNRVQQSLLDIFV